MDRLIFMIDACESIKQAEQSTQLSTVAYLELKEWEGQKG